MEGFNMNEIFVFYINDKNEISYFCSDTFDGSSIPLDIKIQCREYLKQNKIVVIGSNIHVLKSERDEHKLA